MGSTPLDSPREREQEPHERSIGQVRADHLTDWLRAQSQQQLPRYEHPTDAVWYEPWNAEDTRGGAHTGRRLCIREPSSEYPSPLVRHPRSFESEAAAEVADLPPGAALQGACSPPRSHPAAQGSFG